VSRVLIPQPRCNAKAKAMRRRSAQCRIGQTEHGQQFPAVVHVDGLAGHQPGGLATLDRFRLLGQGARVGEP
jgi:hypothetical protein